MKKLCFLLASVMLLSVSVCADILWEPYGDDYYNDHHQDMSYVDAAYFVPEGMRVNVYGEPNGEVLYTMEAGTTVYVGYQTTIYDTIWAVGYSTDLHSEEGWFRLGRLQKQYSHDEFTQDHSDAISSGGSLNAKEITGDVYTWTYPGSGVSAGVLEQDLFQNTNYNDGLLEYSLVYTDPNGEKWGYIGYYMGRCGWAYLDDLYAADPALHLSPQAENTVTDTAPEEAAPGNSMLWIAIPVASLMIVTVILIAVLRKKCKRASS